MIFGRGLYLKLYTEFDSQSYRPNITPTLYEAQILLYLQSQNQIFEQKLAHSIKYCLCH